MNHDNITCLFKEKVNKVVEIRKYPDFDVKQKRLLLHFSNWVQLTIDENLIYKVFSSIHYMFKITVLSMLRNQIVEKPVNRYFLIKWTLR